MGAVRARAKDDRRRHDIRRRIVLAFEIAERETDPQQRAALLTFVIVGAGPTGVELAGTIAELARDTLPADFRNIDTHMTRVVLIKAGPRVLVGYPDDLSAYALRSLENLNVEVELGQAVSECMADGVIYGDRSLASRTIIWATCVQASPAASWVGAPVDRAGRLLVLQDLTVQGHPEIFAIGDTVALRAPMTARVAIEQGSVLGWERCRPVRSDYWHADLWRIRTAEGIAAQFRFRSRTGCGNRQRDAWTQVKLRSGSWISGIGAGQWQGGDLNDPASYMASGCGYPSSRLFRLAATSQLALPAERPCL